MEIYPQILWLESIDYFGTSEHFRAPPPPPKKKRILISKRQDINWSGVVNFHCIQTSLVMSMRFIFEDD